MSTLPTLKDVVDSQLPSIGILRRELHQLPEPSGQEVKTSRKIREVFEAEISKLAGGSQVVNIRSIPEVGGLGLLVDIGLSTTMDCLYDTARSRDSDNRSQVDFPKIIALRADMDALKMEEAQVPGRDHRSSVKGVAHACGHDGHMAMLVGTGMILIQAAVEGRFPKHFVVRLIFQPEEENVSGAKALVDAGCLNGVSEVYGMHNWPTLPEKSISVRAGPVMAHATVWRITVAGVGGHGSEPTSGDVVTCAAHITTMLQTVISRNIRAKDAATLSVCAIAAGNVEAANVIPSSAVISGTTRTFDLATFNIVKSGLERIASCGAEAVGCKAEVEWMVSAPAVVNTTKETEHALRVAKKEFGDGNVGDGDQILPVMASEDFSHYLGVVPGCFVFLGTGIAATLHSPEFDFNDNVLEVGIRFWVRLVEDRCGCQIFSSNPTEARAGE